MKYQTQRKRKRSNKRTRRSRTMRGRQKGSGLLKYFTHKSAEKVKNTIARGSNTFNYLKEKTGFDTNNRPKYFYNKFEFEELLNKSDIPSIFSENKRISISYIKPYYIVQIPVTMRINDSIFLAIKEVYIKTFGNDMEKIINSNTADNPIISSSLLRSLIFFTNRSKNTFHFKEFSDPIFKEINSTQDPKYQKIFWINIYNLLKTYCSERRNNLIPSIQIDQYGNLYNMNINNVTPGAVITKTEGTLEMNRDDIGKIIDNNNNSPLESSIKKFLELQQPTVVKGTVVKGTVVDNNQ